MPQNLHSLFTLVALERTADVMMLGILGVHSQNHSSELGFLRVQAKQDLPSLEDLLHLDSKT